MARLAALALCVLLTGCAALPGAAAPSGAANGADTEKAAGATPDATPGAGRGDTSDAPVQDATASEQQPDSAPQPVGTLFLQRYCLVGDKPPYRTQPANLYDAPSPDAAVLDTLQQPLGYSLGRAFFTLLRQEGDWGYGVWMGQTGWCLLTELSLDETPVCAPDFLPEELLEKYVQARSLYVCDIREEYIAPCDRRQVIEDEDHTPLGQALAYGGQYATFAQVFDGIFTGQLAAQLAPYYHDIDGVLYLESICNAAPGVGYGFDGYRLKEQTEDILTFVRLGTSFLCTPPGVPEVAEEDNDTFRFVKGEDGVWRLDQVGRTYHL